jgi:Ras-related protein Rab-5C
MTRADTMKLVLLGDTGVGKTCLVSRWGKNTFRADQQSTIGAGFTQKSFTYSGMTYKLHIWDTAGQERYQSMAPIYSQNAGGALVVFDLTRPETLANLQKWRDCLDNCPQDIPVVIVGNKSDLADERQVTFDEGIAYSQRMKCEYFETSAENGSGVDDAFSTLAQSAFAAKNAREQAAESQVTLTNQSEPPEESSACC